MSEGTTPEFPSFGWNDGTQIAGDCFQCGTPLDQRALVCPNCGAPNLHYKSGLEDLDLSGGFGCGGCGGHE